MQYKLCTKLRNLKKVLKTLNNDKVEDLTIKSIEANAALDESINGKRNRNKIYSITRDDGSLIEGDILVKNEAIRHFQSIFGCSMPTRQGIGSTLSNIIDKVISNDQANFMGRDITNDEIREESTHWRGNSSTIVANKLCLGVTVYHIWRERNCRIFEGTQKTTSVVALSIIDTIRCRLSSINLKDHLIIALNWNINSS
ncbi:hypothetical protein Dsin_032164 [Dipteronia sinensis]|uniref:Uncharacterized protein n=1 Tax=Dipteronia sinensis TaxID=43782 RepID=A0AAE0DSX2_9ROSI|nr:hypothetical protein Dsin_032164 [Dipteronia sinensis]